MSERDEVGGERDCARVGASPLDGTGAVLYRYVYATMGHSPDYVVSGAGATYRVVRDQLGSPLLIVNITNPTDVILDARYSAFGTRTATTLAAVAPTLGYAGGIYDEDTGLVRFGARDYDALVGRWTSKDPILWDGGQGNLYVYVESNPVNLVDPEGTVVFAPIVAGAALGAALDVGTQLVSNGGDIGAINWTSVGVSAALGAAGGGLGVLGQAKKGYEFSHFIPARYVSQLGLPSRLINSSLNGTFVPRALHIATDPYRFRFVPKALKASTFRFPPGLAQLFRLPPWISGALGGAGVGAATREDGGTCQ